MSEFVVTSSYIWQSYLVWGNTNDKILSIINTGNGTPTVINYGTSILECEAISKSSFKLKAPKAYLQLSTVSMYGFNVEPSE